MRQAYGLVLVLTALSQSCDVYDTGLLPSASGTPRDAATDADPGDASADGCVPSSEICNGIDDDCNGKIDDEPAATAYCEGQLVHAIGVQCSSGKCLGLGCENAHIQGPGGYFNCDGEPSDGCEPYCDCKPCPDGGFDDGGADDGGK